VAAKHKAENRARPGGSIPGSIPWPEPRSLPWPGGGQCARWSVTVAGFVELREESQHTDRFVLRVDRIDGGRIEQEPRRVRLSVKRGMAPPAGSFVEVKAWLEPPLQPLEPGRSDNIFPLYYQWLDIQGQK